MVGTIGRIGEMSAALDKSQTETFRMISRVQSAKLAQSLERIGYMRDALEQASNELVSAEAVDFHERVRLLCEPLAFDEAIELVKLEDGDKVMQDWMSTLSVVMSGGALTDHDLQQVREVHQWMATGGRMVRALPPSATESSQTALDNIPVAAYMHPDRNDLVSSEKWVYGPKSRELVSYADVHDRIDWLEKGVTHWRAEAMALRRELESFSGDAKSSSSPSI